MNQRVACALQQSVPRTVENPREYFETCVRLRQAPLEAATKLASSGIHTDYVVYENAGQWSFAGGSLAEVTLDRFGARLDLAGSESKVLPWDGQPLRLVQQLLSTVSVTGWRAYGWAAFELCYAKDGALDHIGRERLLHLIVPQTEVRFVEGNAYLRSADRATLAAATEVLLARGCGGDKIPPHPVDVRQADAASYQEAVKVVIDDINARKLEKVIISRVVPVDQDVDFVGTYVLGRQANNPARSFLLHLGGVQAAGFSPEIVVQVDGNGRVVTQPLAGTRAMTNDDALNARLRAELFADAKEVYEHAISVKVAWDEMLDVCKPGTVGVEEFMVIKERGTVQHLGSRVAGQLADGCNSWDAFGAVFPAVTASGVPKAAAYEYIRSHESQARGLYSGSVLTVDSTGEMDAALVLRTVYRQDGRTWLQAGAGIVGQSRPKREFEETVEKLDSVARYLVPAEAWER